MSTVKNIVIDFYLSRNDTNRYWIYRDALNDYCLLKYNVEPIFIYKDIDNLESFINPIVFTIPINDLQLKNQTQENLLLEYERIYTQLHNIQKGLK